MPFHRWCREYMWVKWLPPNADKGCCLVKRSINNKNLLWLDDWTDTFGPLVLYFIVCCNAVTLCVTWLYLIIHSILPLPLSLALALPLLTVTVTAPPTVLLSVPELSWVELSLVSERESEWVTDWVTEWLTDWLTEWLSDWVTEWWISSMMCLALIPIRATWAMSSWRWGNSTALFCTVCMCSMCVV
jgi:hypothetical protein